MALKFLFFLLLMVLCSCGEKSKSSQQRQEVTLTGNYRAILTPVNSGVLQNKSFGTAIIELADDQLKIRVNMAATPAGITHLQFIHASSECPTANSDTNGDGLVDIDEGKKHFGEPLVVLDSNLNTQDVSNLPRSDGSGYYAYTQSASLSEVTATLPANQQLTFEGQHFVVYGVSSHAELPESVATISNFSAEASLPIACGQIVRVPNEDL